MWYEGGSVEDVVIESRAASVSDSVCVSGSDCVQGMDGVLQVAYRSNLRATLRVDALAGTKLSIGRTVLDGRLMRRA